MSAVDDEGRCTHWHGPDDVLWLRLACCSSFWPCRACHDEATSHGPRTWPPGANAKALRCGRCRHAFHIQGYLANPDACPACGGAFNPACWTHHDQYFDAVIR